MASLAERVRRSSTVQFVDAPSKPAIVQFDGMLAVNDGASSVVIEYTPNVRGVENFTSTQSPGSAMPGVNKDTSDLTISVPVPALPSNISHGSQ